MGMIDEVIRRLTDGSVGDRSRVLPLISESDSDNLSGDTLATEKSKNFDVLADL